MAEIFQNELESIFVTLRGSTWALEPEVNTVIEEFERLVEASTRLRHVERKSALQILFSSRAIDSLFTFVVNRNRLANGQPLAGNVTIGQGINETRGYLNPFVVQDLEEHVRDNRNRYLHQAGIFPSIEDMELFLLATAIGIGELVIAIP